MSGDQPSTGRRRSDQEQRQVREEAREAFYQKLNEGGSTDDALEAYAEAYYEGLLFLAVKHHGMR